MKAKVGIYNTQRGLMKRHGNLFEKIIDKDNIRLAHKNARKGKTFYNKVKDIDLNLEYYVDEIHNMLVNKTHEVGEYKMFKKNDKGKVREIFKLDYYPDRIIHHAILQVLEPIWKGMLIKNTYQSIKGRGVKACKRDVNKFIGKNTDKDLWILKIDINKFYPSVDNTILNNIVSRKIKCKDALWLLYTIIDSKEGLPIGNYISQYLGNLYLSYFDQSVISRKDVKNYFRYCDDIVIVAENKEAIKHIYSYIEHYLEYELNLKIKSNKQYYALQFRNLDFVGYVFLSNGKVKLRNNIKVNMCKAMKSNKPEVISAYYGWVLEARAFGLWNKYYKGVKYGNKKCNRR